MKKLLICLTCLSSNLCSIEADDPLLSFIELKIEETKSLLYSLDHREDIVDRTCFLLGELEGYSQIVEFLMTDTYPVNSRDFYHKMLEYPKE